MSQHSDVLFWIIRHGSTEANEEDIYRSWSNDKKAQLSDQGRQGMDDAATYLAAVRAPIKMVIADSLDRTIESAERVGRKFDVSNYQFLRGLHPLNMGDFTLKPKKDHPVDEYMKDPDKSIPGGESRREFDQRQQKTFRAIMECVPDFPPGSIAIIAHGSNVSYLHNEVFNPQAKSITYEGLVNPGGIVRAGHNELKALTNLRSKTVGKE